jgi:receptor protein-tyrosine kinase
MDAAPKQLTFRDYLVPVMSRRWLVLAIVAAVAGAAYAYEARKVPTYTASTMIYVGQQGDPQLGIGAGTSDPRTVANQAQLLTSTGVAATVAKTIGYKGSAAGLAGAVTATPSLTTDFVTVTAHAASGGEAARIANGFAQAFVLMNTSKTQAAANKAIAELRTQLNRLPKGVSGQSNRSGIISQIGQLQVAASSGVGNATQINPAIPPTVSGARPPWEYALAAGFAALIGAVLLAYMLYRLDFHLQSVEQAIELYQRPVLGTIVHDADIDCFVDKLPALSKRSKEAFRELRVALDLAAPDTPFKTLVVTSAGAGEGKSTVARNLAIAMCEAGRRVALIDADLRRPALPKRLGVESGYGVTDVLAGDCSLADALTTVPIAASASVSVPARARLHDGSSSAETNGKAAWLPEVTLLNAGSSAANPPTVIESEGFRSLIQTLADSHDIVMIDTTPMTAVTDAIPLLARVDAVLIITRSGTTDRRSARHAAEIIDRVPGINAIGIVVNGLPPAEASAYGASYYGYGYRYGGRERSRSEAKHAVTDQQPPNGDDPEQKEEPDRERSTSASRGQDQRKSAADQPEEAGGDLDSA